MVLDRTYFKQGLVEVANQTTIIGGKESTSMGDTLDTFIARYQKDFMYKLLGKTLADEYLSDSSAEKWVALDGYLFDTELKVSPIANYVFYYYQQSTWTRNAGVGAISQTAENSTLANNQRICDVWNQMVLMMRPTLDFILDHSDDYPIDSCEEQGYDWTNFLSTINVFGL